MNRYQGLQLLFLDIANIHAMRDSIDKLFNVCDSVQENKWYSQLESTQWLTHLRSVLKVNAYSKNTVICNFGFFLNLHLHLSVIILFEPCFVKSI